MAVSPSENASDVVKLSLKVEGEDVTNSVKISSVHINKAVNRVASATVTILDGDMPEQTFPQSDKADFAPGKKIEIGAGYGDDESPVFKGIIVKHSLRIEGENASSMILECKDVAVKMTVSRNNANFVVLASGDEVKDSAVMTEIIGNYSDITADVEATTPVLSSLVQFGSSDWDFIVARAEANAMLVMCSDGKLSVKIPDLSAEAVLTLVYGKDIIFFNADLDSRFQYKKVTSVGWDPKTLEVMEEQAAPESDSSEQAITNGDLTTVMGIEDFKMNTQTSQVKQSLSNWTKGQLSKSKLSLLRGQVKFQGSAIPTLGSMIELKGVGKRFSGNVFCSAIEHVISDGEWSTEIEFGCSQHWFSESPDVTKVGASGLVPAAQGLQIGIVKKLDEDPDGQYRIQVTVPLLQAENQGIWARMSHYYASSSFGAFFIPEIGDEVVMGYLNNDPSYPVILGSMYSQKNKAPEELTADNFIKTLVTKSKLTMQFDDDKKIITLETPGGHSIVMDDDAKTITLTDSNSNVLKMSDSGISLTSPKDITLKADGDISFTATGDIKASATGDAKIDGMNVNVSAQSAFSAAGNASAELTASGNTTVKGAMVMIN